MTTEIDIIKFLFDNDYFKIAEYVLNSSDEPRFIEIILGITGNMTCDPLILDALAENEKFVELILRYLSFEDSATLVQVLRLLRSALWSIQTNPESKWRDHLRNSTILREIIPFILKSSTNEELLITTTSFLRTAADIDLPTGETLLNELFLSSQSSSFLSEMLESFQEVLPQDENHYSPSTLKYFEDWLEVFSNLPKDQLYLEILQDDNLARTVEIPRRILTNFVDPCNIHPLDGTKASCIYRCAEMILDFRLSKLLTAVSTVDINSTILKIIDNIDTAMKEEEEDPEEAMDELLKYLEGYWVKVSSISSTDEILNILKTNEKVVIDHTISLLKSKIPEEKIDRIRAGLSNE
ncbi:uncharacterized protein LOC108627018 isoform X2 [Ceratina calcarata]|nr:uncharacterized protein LOC108627018 isoform X2 [Ceratina calcarata]